MPLDLHSARELPDAPVTGARPQQSRTTTRLGNFFRGAALATLGLLATTGTASARPPQEIRAEQVDLSRLTERELIANLKQILGEGTVNFILRPSEDEREDYYSGRTDFLRIMSEERCLSTLTSNDIDDDSPAQKLARLQSDRARKIDLAGKLKPFLAEAKTRGLSWAFKFDYYLQIPPEPHVNFAYGALAALSNRQLLGQVKELLGSRTVDGIISPCPEDEREDYYSGRTDFLRIMSEERCLSTLTSNDRDDDSPAQKLARLQSDRAKKIELAGKLKPFLAEAKTRGLSWAFKFDYYLQIPPEPHVNFAYGALAALSNMQLLAQAKDILGVERADNIISPCTGNRRRSYPPGQLIRTLDRNITEEEAVKLAPLLSAAHKRHLSWASKVAGFLPKIEKQRESAPETPAEDPKKTRKIRALERQLNKKYGIRIAYGNNPSVTEFSADKPTDQELIVSQLIKLSQLVTKYPSNVRARLRNITIYFADNIIYLKTNATAAGLAGDTYMVVDIEQYLPSIFDHEFFHILDKSEGLEPDNETWAKLNRGGMADYRFLHGADALDVEGEGPSREGFAGSTYSIEGGPDEDQAVTAEDLLNSWKAYTLTMRAKTDDILRNKLEAITGCLFDQVTGKFVRQLTLQEYKERLGFNDFQYYAAASRLPSGKLTMGPSYWNAIAASGEWHGVR